MNRVLTLLALIALGLAGCNPAAPTASGPTPSPTSITAAPTTARNGTPGKPEAIDVSRLEFKLPDGWKTSHGHREVKLEKFTPGDDGLNHPSWVYVFPLRWDTPEGQDEFLAKLKEKDFLDTGFVWTEITEKGSLPDGWFIKGQRLEYASKTAKPIIALVMMRKFDGQPVLCNSGLFRSEALREEALEAFRSAKLKPAP